MRPMPPAPPHRLALLAWLALVLPWTAQAASGPATASPGSASDEPTPAAACTPFSWGLTPGAAGYEVEVRREADAGAEEEPALRVVVEGQIGAWQPGPDRCLGEGVFRWRVRARPRGEGLAAGPWSSPRRFVVRAVTEVERRRLAVSVAEWALRHGGGAVRREPSPPSPNPPADRLVAGQARLPVEDIVRRSLAAASATGGQAALRGRSSDAGGATAGAVGVTSSAAAGGVVGMHVGNGADVILGGDVDDSADFGYLRSDAGGVLRITSLEGVLVITSELEVENAGQRVFHLDENGLTATSFTGDGSALSGVVAAALSCTDCVAPSGEILNGSLGAADLFGLGPLDVALGAIGSAVVADGSVSGVDFATGSIGAEDVATAAVDASHVVSNAVGSSELVDGAVADEHLADGAVRAPDLAAVRRVKVSCDGECDDASLSDACAAGVAGSRPIGFSCNFSDRDVFSSPFCGQGNNRCIHAFSEVLDCDDVSGTGDAIVLCLDP